MFRIMEFITVIEFLIRFERSMVGAFISECANPRLGQIMGDVDWIDQYMITRDEEIYSVA